ncbi:MAG: pyrroline-5-carboxylate reductase [Elusimicrobiota bacterium]
MQIVIVGCGRMGTALLKSVKTLNNTSVCVIDIDSSRRKIARELGVEAFSKFKQAPEADIYIIAVKPSVAPSVFKKLAALERDFIALSIAAGINTGYLKKMIPRAAVMRAMPNIALVRGRGMTALCAPPEVSKKDIEKVKPIFSASGFCEVVEEKLFDAITAVSGSGPAYFFYLGEIMSEFLVNSGMNKEQANKFVSRTVLGAGALMSELGEDFKNLRYQVTSPGGTTEAALEHLKKEGFGGVFYQALEKANLRSGEISENLLKTYENPGKD